MDRLRESCCQESVTGGPPPLLGPTPDPDPALAADVGIWHLLAAFPAGPGLAGAWLLLLGPPFGLLPPATAAAAVTAAAALLMAAAAALALLSGMEEATCGVKEKELRKTSS